MRTLVAASLAYYRAVNAMVILGVALAVAVLAGALVVGASVRASLRDLALSRLGQTQVAVSAGTFFRAPLGDDLGAPAFITTTGTLVHDESGRVAARVQVFGIDQRFLRFHGLDPVPPQGREAWISAPLARELEADRGDNLLLRVAKPGDIPLGTLQGRRDDAGERIRLSVGRIAGAAQLGEFSLAPSQGPALTIFVALDRLQNDLDQRGRANSLVSGVGDTVEALTERIRARATLDDYGLRLRTTPEPQTLVVESRAGVMSQPAADAIASAARASGASAEQVLVHLANTIRIRDKAIPYSLIAGRGTASGLLLNEWAARELDARPGDRVDLEYYVWSDATGLETRRADAAMSGVVAMSADGGDRTFTPDYPGLTDADSVSNWDPPFPVELERVRRVDEDYWDTWRAAPKAFVPLALAQQLWATPHGNISSIRVTAPPGSDLTGFRNRLDEAVRRAMTPEAVGFVIRDARREALAAAEGTTDFGEYFVYFSFFIVVAGLLLAGLFFALAVEQRAREIGLLGAVGYSRRDIARVLMVEGIVLAGAGGVLGIAGAIGYAALIMYGLRTWWRDAVGTSALTLHVDPILLTAGALSAVVAAAIALVLSLRAHLGRTPRALLSGEPELGPQAMQRGSRSWLMLGWTMLAVALVAATVAGAVPAAGGFFGAGAALMVAGLSWFSAWLRTPARITGRTSVGRFGAAYTRWRPSRSVMSVALMTFACFVIVSVGAFRRDGDAPLERSGGTGGFTLLAESVAPLMHNPNTSSGKDDLGLAGEPLLDRMQVARFRLKPGDDASCLSLYQPRNPRIIAPEPSFLDAGRFRFAASLARTGEEQQNPWRLLQRRFDDGAVPAIADQTSLTYVFHLAVGDDFVITSDTGQPTTLRIVGALADSVLQSELIVPEDAFVRLFPRREGYGVWLIDAPAESAEPLTSALEDRLSDYGVDVVDTRARLASYHRVENTYLSTFQALGALGLLVGTFGLAAVLARNVIERRRELVLLTAVGYTPSHLRTIVLSESMLIVGAGLLLGTATALVAVMPALLERSSAVPIGPLALLLAGVTASGALAATLAARLATATPLVTAIKSD